MDSVSCQGKEVRKMVVAFERVVCHFLRSNCCTPKSAVLFCTHLPGLVPVTCGFSEALDARCLHCKVLLTLDSNVNLSLSLKPTVGWNSRGQIRDLVTPERAPTIKKNKREIILPMLNLRIQLSYLGSLVGTQLRGHFHRIMGNLQVATPL